MKWFGETWNAPVCEPTERIDIPVGDKCVQCGEAFVETSQGVAMPFFDGTTVSRVGYHRLCLLQNLGLALTVHMLYEGLPLCRFTTEIPAHWPHLHVWTSLRHEANCRRCKKVYDEHLADRPNA